MRLDSSEDGNMASSEKHLMPFRNGIGMNDEIHGQSPPCDPPHKKTKKQENFRE